MRSLTGCQIKKRLPDQQSSILIASSEDQNSLAAMADKILEGTSPLHVFLSPTHLLPQPRNHKKTELEVHYQAQNQIGRETVSYLDHETGNVTSADIISSSPPGHRSVPSSAPT